MLPLTTHFLRLLLSLSFSIRNESQTSFNPLHNEATRISISLVQKKKRAKSSLQGIGSTLDLPSVTNFVNNPATADRLRTEARVRDQWCCGLMRKRTLHTAASSHSSTTLQLAISFFDNPATADHRSGQV